MELNHNGIKLTRWTLTTELHKISSLVAWRLDSLINVYFLLLNDFT